ncbi:MAG: histidine phosphatase family protein [Tissierellia bacterium]|nr:histidine phosphatase family protein [Tissierellia bacterium]
MKIYMIRHGETEGNRKGFFADRYEPLNDRGREQIRAAAQRAKELPLEQLITSPYVRTLETSKILNEQLQLPVTEDIGIREIHMGILEGHYFDEVYQLRRQELDYWMEDPRNRTLPEGESIDELLQRGRAFLEGARDRTLYVSHEAFIRSVLSLVQGCDFIQARRVENGELVCLEQGPGGQWCETEL